MHLKTAKPSPLQVMILRQQFFSQLNSFFDKVFVITLQRAIDRQEHVLKELEGLQFEFFFGKDKNEFNVAELQQRGIYSETLAKKHHRYHKPMPAGMVGCSWSHREVYQKIVDENLGKVLILEDDVVVNENSISLFEKMLQQLPLTWQLLYLGFAEKESVPLTAEIKKAIYHAQRFFGGLNYSHKTISNLYPKKVSSHVFKAGYHDCTHAYGLTRSAAQTLLRLQTPISFFPDNLLAHAATNELLESYILLPKLIDQQYQLGITSASYINH